VVIALNGIILQVLFVSVSMGAFFLLKRRERSGKNYPISFRKTFKMDKNYPFYKTESNFDAIRVKTYVYFFRIDPLYVF
jgi:hypothetical protein